MASSAVSSSEPGMRMFGTIRCLVRPSDPRLVEFTYPKGFTLVDFRAAMEFTAMYGAANAPIVVLTEVRGTVPVGAAGRREMADIMQAHDATAASYLCASAVVTDSALMRGVLTAVTWIHSPPYLQRAFADDVEARAWLRQCLAARV